MSERSELQKHSACPPQAALMRTPTKEAGISERSELQKHSACPPQAALMRTPTKEAGT